MVENRPTTTQELTEERVKLRERMVASDIEFIRACVRPILTIGGVAAWIVFVFMTYDQGGTIDDVPLLFTVLAFSGWIWYFGERSISKAFSALKG